MEAQRGVLLGEDIPQLSHLPDADLERLEIALLATRRERAIGKGKTPRSDGPEQACQVNEGFLRKAGASGAQGLTLENVADAFRYQSWDGKQIEEGEQVREALVASAKTILRVVPEGPARTRTLNLLIDARMVANLAITWRGRF